MFLICHMKLNARVLISGHCDEGLSLRSTSGVGTRWLLKGGIMQIQLF